ncbi:hypothetical protein [Roseivivax sp. CAU 1753]
MPLQLPAFPEVFLQTRNSVRPAGKIARGSRGAVVAVLLQKGIALVRAVT